MRIVLKVWGSNEYCDGGCEFARVDLTPELAALALGRIAVLREQKSLDPDIDETYYWAYFADYFSPWEDLASSGKEVEDTRAAVEDTLGRLQIDEKEIICVPESFEVSPSQIAAVECEQMIVRQDSIAFMAIPKHASFYVQTAEIPLAMLEAAVAASGSTTPA
jgi:hypothetical protein